MSQEEPMSGSASELDASYDPISGEVMIALRGQVPTILGGALLFQARRFVLFVHGNRGAMEFTFDADSSTVRLELLDDENLELGLVPIGEKSYRLVLQP